jgi:hypothetical protein
MALATTVSRAARAHEAVVWNLTYQVTAGCPAESDFVALVHARTDAEFTRGSGAPRATVRASSELDGFSGRLELVSRDGSEMIREVSGATCEGVISALALVAALTLDAAAMSASLDQEPLPPLSRPAEETPPRAEQAAPPPPAPWVAPRSSDAPPWRLGLGAGAATVGGFAPGVALAGSVFVDITLDRATLPVSFRLDATRVFPEDTAYPWGTGSVDMLGGGVQACALRWPLGQRLAMRPCAAAAVGKLDTAGRLTSGSSRNEEHLWTSVAAAFRMEWRATSHWQFEASFGPVFPLTRYSFIVASPDTLYYRSPAVAGMLALGVAFFP